MSWVEIIGWSATAVGALLGFPQLFRLLRTRNVAGLSLLAWQAVLVLNVIWFTHGVRIGQGPQIVTNSVALASTLPLLVLLARATRRSVFAVVAPSLVAAAVYLGNIWVSNDSGVTMTEHSTGAVQAYTGIACSADGRHLLASVMGGDLWHSPNCGVSWLGVASSRNWQSAAVSGDGTALAGVVNPGYVYVSGDGGMTWRETGSSHSWYGVAFSADGSRLVAVPDSAQIYTSRAATTAGTAGYLQGGSDSAVELQYLGGDLYRILSHAGTITAY